MIEGERFSRLYSDVSDSITAAMADIAELKVEHKDGKQELSNMMERLRSMQASFNGELVMLEQHSEWDKFTIAFFGETNAGKSTIIESLRILFNEDSRQQLLQHNGRDLAKFEQALAGHVCQVRDGLNRVCAAYASEISEIRQSAATLTWVLQEESSARVKRKILFAAIGGFALGVIMAGVFVLLSRA